MGIELEEGCDDGLDGGLCVLLFSVAETVVVAAVDPVTFWLVLLLAGDGIDEVTFDGSDAVFELPLVTTDIGSCCCCGCEEACTVDATMGIVSLPSFSNC